MGFEYWEIILLVLFFLGCGLYGYIASQNTEEVQVQFLREKKKLSLKYVILICFVDGLFLGVFLGYILFKGLMN